MKPQILFLMIMASLSSQAQTNLIEFLQATRDGFNHAHVIRTNPAYLVVSCDSGLHKIWMTNLPPILQTEFDFDPQKAAAAIQEEQEHAAAVRKAMIEEQKRLEQAAGPVQSVQCLAILDNFGMCQIKTTNGIIRAYIVGLPENVKQSLINYFQAKQALADKTAQANNLANRAERADANAPVAAAGDAAYVNAAMAQRTTANNLAVNANDAAQSAMDLKNSLETMEMTIESSTTFNAYPTGLFDNGIPRWQAVQ